jgi:CRISPR-associated endonuclease Cas2
MSYHIVSIDSPQCSLSCKDGQLTCKTAEGERKLPLEDVASIIITSFSASIHSELFLEAAMMQFSVYARAGVTFARQETHIDRLKKYLPPEGSVRAIFVTRAQWERSYIIQGAPATEAEAEEIPEQIQLW